MSLPQGARIEPFNDLKKGKIRVNLVSPGTVVTPAYQTELRTKSRSSN